MDEGLRVGRGNKRFNEHGAVVGSTTTPSEHVGMGEEIRDLMNMEQLLEVLPPHLSTWVWERKPTTGVKAGELRDE